MPQDSFTKNLKGVRCPKCGGPLMTYKTPLAFQEGISIEVWCEDPRCDFDPIVQIPWTEIMGDRAAPAPAELEGKPLSWYVEDGYADNGQIMVACPPA